MVEPIGTSSDAGAQVTDTAPSMASIADAVMVNSALAALAARPSRSPAP
jgi:hypothetical protein